MINFSSLQGTLFTIGVVSFLLYIVLNKIGIRSLSKLMVVIAVLSIAGGFGVEPLSEKLEESNDEKVTSSAYLQSITEDFDIIGSDPCRLLYSPASIKVQKPYMIVQLDEVNGKAVPSELLSHSNTSFISEKALQSCKTILFCLSDNWETAYYTGVSHTPGTSERKMCYLYDVETGLIFAEKEFKARELPDTTKVLPQYKVNVNTLIEYVEGYLN